MNKKGVWSEQAEDASYSLISSYQTDAKVTNHLFQLVSGSWQMIEQANDLPAKLRGYHFIVFPVRRTGKQFLSFNSIRWVDQEMISQGLFTDLSLYDNDGSTIDNPLFSRDNFLLSPEDARVFARRLEKIGGVLQRGQIKEIDHGQTLLRLIDEKLKELENILSQDVNFLQELEQGNSTARLQFDDRGEQFRQKSRSVLKTINQLEKHLSDCSERQLSSDEKQQIMQFKQQASSKTELLDQIRHSRSRAETLSAQLLAGNKQQETEKSIMAEQILLKDLAQTLQRKGIKCIEKDGSFIAKMAAHKIIIDSQGIKIYDDN